MKTRPSAAPGAPSDEHAFDADAEPARAAPPRPVRGRGATFNPENRFRRDSREAVDDGWAPAGSDPTGEGGSGSVGAAAEGTAGAAIAGAGDDEPPPLQTTVSIQQARTIISRNASPDIPFTQSINPYQGCEHGCVYCYARPSHAYLDLSPGLDFETKLFAKPNAAQLLRAELAKPGYACDPIALGTNTDPYQPIEREWKVTRAILEVLAETRHPFTIVTKSSLVERDLDLIAPMAARNLARVYVSVTTLDRRLARTLEPRAAAPQRRLADDPRAGAGRRPGRRDDGADHPAAQRPRPRGDSRGRARPARATRAGRCCACRARWRRCSASGSTRTTRCAPST